MGIYQTSKSGKTISCLVKLDTSLLWKWKIWNDHLERKSFISFEENVKNYHRWKYKPHFSTLPNFVLEAKYKNSVEFRVVLSILGKNEFLEPLELWKEIDM